MKEPRPELMATDDERAESPDFDALTDPKELVSGDRTRDDFFDAVLGLDSPATVSEVADRAGHGVDAAREYLEWFERMGIITQVTESPATYERNQEYLHWRRVQKLREEYTTDELLSRLETERERDESYGETFDVDSPDAVSITEHASDTDRAVEDVWNDASAWKTTRRRIGLLERALTAGPENATEERTAV
ncbi:DUF7342 family protein [Natronobacterium gregoryi]|uniref:Sugar-specific transcriptional regulator TrmB n=1 Tax=Natronobacterium gregoryi (strain ATCC 43098 / DSM 3393 / CCM 3738 / CIP 104747 / IAM 13177 / JCM 8860 / NBRC 102187 / NCIMB 2189 / SP2) TaxID=797304 RepID=A0A2J4JAU2_NATGS|nr:hypothetical protein CYV19_17155 [Natronobacterium gregoryi SP2]